MIRIKIQDLPKDMKVSEDQMKQVLGGVEPTTFPVIAPGTFSVFDAGRFSQGIKGVNVKDLNPVEYFPGSHWRSK